MGLLVTCKVSLWSQSNEALAKADSVTYALYLKGEWKELLHEGRKFIAEDVDFYYLRMRMAWAYFQKKQYRMAIPHYRKALEFIPNDQYALMYLVYAYEYSGRGYDALATSASLDSLTRKNSFDKYNAPFVGTALFFTYNSGNAGHTQKQMNMDDQLDTDGIQKTTNNYRITTAYLGHRMGRRITFHHSLAYLKKNEHNFVTYGGELYENEKQDLFQWSYNAQLLVRVGNGFTVMPVYNHVHFKIPTDVAGYRDYKESSDIYGGMIQKDFTIFKVGASYITGKMNMATQNQVGMHLAIFPKGNLNLYYVFDAYQQNQEVAGESLSNFIYKNQLGFRVTDYWWMEASGTFPSFHNFYETSTGALWNGLEGTKNLWNLNQIFLTKKAHVSFIFNVGWYESESVFVPTDDITNRQNVQSYSNINITGGIVWKP